MFLSVVQSDFAIYELASRKNAFRKDLANPFFNGWYEPV
jgi:hypothetical protein